MPVYRRHSSWFHSYWSIRWWCKQVCMILNTTNIWHPPIPSSYMIIQPSIQRNSSGCTYPFFISKIGNKTLLRDLIANKRLTYYIYMRYTYSEFILCVFCSHYPFPYLTVTSLLWKVSPFLVSSLFQMPPLPPSALFWRHPPFSSLLFSVGTSPSLLLSP